MGKRGREGNRDILKEKRECGMRVRDIEVEIERERETERERERERENSLNDIRMKSGAENETKREEKRKREGKSSKADGYGVKRDIGDLPATRQNDPAKILSFQRAK